MKPVCVLVALLSVLSFTRGAAQSKSILASAKKMTIKNYYDLKPIKLDSNEIKVLLHLSYGSAEIRNPHDVPKLYNKSIKKVRLFYSDYPKDKNSNSLNRKRIKTLLEAYEAYAPAFPEDVEWEVIKQGDCQSQAEATKLFHGFEVIVEFGDDYDLATARLDSSFNDFVVEAVLDRNNWHEMVIVTDFTASMAPYIAQLFVWFKLNTIDDRIKQFVFFNDGDSQLDADKKIGKTGGIYHTRAKDYDAIERVAVQCMLSGSGGDIQENDLEALLRGIELCPDCKERILIVDNHAPVRDLKLLRRIKVPVRIIVCGAQNGINLEYLNIARKTKGSIHLMEEDLFNLMRINEGEEITIGEYKYVIKNDKFEKVKQL